MYFEDLESRVNVGFRLDPVTIEKEKMLAFAKEYDNHPLHTDEAYAETTQFERLIAPGIMSFMSVWNQYLKKDPIGTELVAGASNNVEWYAPVYAGDTLTGMAAITRTLAKNPYTGVVEITIEAYNQKSDLVLRGITEVVVKRRGWDSPSL